MLMSYNIGSIGWVYMYIYICFVMRKAHKQWTVIQSESGKIKWVGVFVCVCFRCKNIYFHCTKVFCLLRQDTWRRHRTHSQTVFFAACGMNILKTERPVVDHHERVVDVRCCSYGGSLGYRVRWQSTVAGKQLLHTLRPAYRSHRHPHNTSTQPRRWYMTVGWIRAWSPPAWLVIVYVSSLTCLEYKVRTFQRTDRSRICLFQKWKPTNTHDIR